MIVVDIVSELFNPIWMFMDGQKAQGKICKSLGVVLRSLLLVCVLITYGGGSSLMQGVAWVSMLSSEMVNSSPFEDGVERTFSGENPCALCDLASSLREVEESANHVPSNKLSKQADVVEKMVNRLSSVRCFSPASTLILIEREQRESLIRISLEVDIPPPDFV